ncbi:MAG TPA: hypothetical protein VK929_05555 [Longimicrobiales bacterium]|nr:hypothetical protein [Longimicrobiales bacterium]
MATLRNTQRETGGTPWGWIIGLVVLAVVTFGIIWWMRAGAPPAGVTDQQGVEQTMPATPPAGNPPATDPAPGQPPP